MSSPRSKVLTIQPLTTARAPPLLRGPHPIPASITCTSSAKSLYATVSNNTCTSTPKAYQDTPELGGVVERLCIKLESGEVLIIEHDPSKSLTLGGECSTLLSRTYDRVEHSLRIAAVWHFSAAAIESTSCLPQEGVLCHEMQHGCETRQYASDTENDETMVDDDEEPMWDVEFDDETLSQFYDNRLNLVLDSVAPHLAPHIVITPPEETWEDQYISWKNRVDFQWPQFLEVPALNVISGRLPIPEDTQPMFGPGTLTPSFSPTNPLLIPTPIFSHSKFRQQIDSASMERLVFTQVVAALHKAQCKAVFFYASNTAYTFRKRYDLHPNVLSTLDQSFAWTDPAEPLLAANRRLLGTTIIDSVCPFRAPHIIINAPPPQPPQITECNATPYAQDAAFGQRLIVRSCSTEIVNAADDWDQYASSYDSDDDGDAFSDADQDSADPLVSDDGFSRPGTPAPGTPVDEDDDHDFFYARHGDDGHDHDNMRMHTTPTTGYASYGYGYRTSHAAVVEAVLVVASAQGKFAEFQATSRPMFFIEEDEDELPSLDDW